MSRYPSDVAANCIRSREAWMAARRRTQPGRGRSQGLRRSLQYATWPLHPAVHRTERTRLDFADLSSSPMHEALQWAEKAIGVCEPNPRVGCVIVGADGRVIGRGHTQQAGGPHAEVMALRDAASQGHSVRGATAWVTLEPCSHHGRTPPCCDAFVEAGVGRVVVAIEDPNPLVAGAGIRRLCAAGIDVAFGPGAEESR